MANNKTKANRDNPAPLVVAPTMAVGKTDSTEATATVAGLTKAAVRPSIAVVAVIPPKAPQTLDSQSRNLTIGTIAIPMAATSITTTQAPPACNLVSITNMPPPGPTLRVVTSRGSIKPYSQVPLANAPRLLNQPRHPPATPPPSQCHLATKDCGSLLLLAAGALARMQLPTNAPTTFPLPNQEHP